MNSEQWERLWRVQVPPPSAVNLDSFMAGLRDEPDQWEREIDHTDGLALKLQWLCLVVSLPGLFVRPGEWTEWLMPLGYLGFVVYYWSRRRQRRRIYSDYGLPLRERLERMELLLRRRAALRLDLVFLVVLTGLFGGKLWLQLSPAGLGAAVGAGLAVAWLGLIAWCYREQIRRDRVRLEGMLAKLASARSRLDGS